MDSPSWVRVTRAPHALCAAIMFIGLAILTEINPLPASAQTHPKHGGSLTALEASIFSGAWNGLDPPTDTNSSANATILNAIYGGLFQQAPGGALEGDLASGYKLSPDGLTADIYLRQGVTFQDGTPFNAQAVVFNIERDLEPQYACICARNMPLSSVVAAGPYTVVLHLKSPYAPIFSAFVSETPNWIVSPAALQKDGEAKFAQIPVGAGPFEVVSDTPNAVVKLRRNPTYWEKGHPYLNDLTFMSIGSDSSAVDALQTGQAQLYENINPVELTPSQASQVIACNPPSDTLVYVQFDTLSRPFNNPLAREAVSYATDPGPILKAIYHDQGKVTQSPTAPGGLFYEQYVPGYHSYNLAKAKALVKQMGGLHVVLTTVNSTTFDETEVALQAQWARAGITTTLQQTNIVGLVEEFKNNSFQANLASMGTYDPALVPGVSFHFGSAYLHGASGVGDPHLDQLLASAASALTNSDRLAFYKQAYRYIAEKAYGVFMFSAPSAVIKTKNVGGLSCSSLLGSVHWDSVWLK